jgi:hypothetical protein
MWILQWDKLSYFEDFLRDFGLRPATLREAALVRREAEAFLAAFLRPALGRRDARGERLTFAATAPSVDPIERATVTRKSFSFAAGLCSLIFFVLSMTIWLFGVAHLIRIASTSFSLRLGTDL